jgi:hypothetical protein
MMIHGSYRLCIALPKQRESGDRIFLFDKLFTHAYISIQKNHFCVNTDLSCFTPNFLLRQKGRRGVTKNTNMIQLVVYRYLLGIQSHSKRWKGAREDGILYRCQML